MVMCAFRQSRRCMRCWIARASSSADVSGGATKPAARPFQKPFCPTICGVWTTRGIQTRQRPVLLPLTVTDQVSRTILMCEAHESTRQVNGFTAFQRLFEEYGLPDAIRYDNGLPFASPNGLFNLSKLSVWWLRLGISIERIKPGNPQQNGRHERMHLTLKKETTRPPGMNALQQQARFDEFVHEFNTERPHEALGMKIPDEVYAPSNRSYQGLPEVEYPFHDRDILVTACGRICMHRKKINISTVLAGQRLGIKEVDGKRCSVPTFHLSFWSVIFPDMLICQWRFLWEYKVMSVWSTLIGWRFWLTRLVDAYGAMQ